MKKALAVLMILVFALCTGCGGGTFKHLTHDEAQKMIATNSNVVIVDVRTQEEFDKKHIPKALLVPIEDLQAGDFSKLPDKDATLLIYCWTGRRAEDSAKILADEGYKNVYEMGGLVDWTGKLEGTEVAKQISQEETQDIIKTNPDVVLVDCRSQQDYEAKRIPGSVFIPLEAVMADDLSKLPDKDAMIICYCAEGKRSSEVAKLLVEKGYTNVSVMGSLRGWTGALEGTEVVNAKHLSHDEAREILATDPNAVLVDCRFPKDYEAKHIVGAIFVPKEAVMAEDFSKIPDKNATLICYCGDGNRARQTSRLLIEKGYKNVYEMGGIIDWTGPVEGTNVK